VHVIWLAVALVAAVSCGALGYVIGNHSYQLGAAAKAGAAAANAPRCSSSSSTAVGVGVKLASKLLPMPRSVGAKYLRGRYTGQVDSLDQFVSTLYNNSSAERQRLVAQCFQIGAQQGWDLPSGRIVAVYLAQFASSADARSYALATQSADLDDSRNKIHATVSGISDGMLIEAPGLDKYGNTECRLIGDKGNVAIIIHVFEPSHLPSRSLVTPLLLRQAARL
jgi:hypothetical protein